MPRQDFRKFREWSEARIVQFSFMVPLEDEIAATKKRLDFQKYFTERFAEMHGKPMPESITKGQPIAQLQGAKLSCFGPQWNFVKAGQSGQEISEIFPNLAKVADEMCIIRSMKTEAINHDPAHTFMNTGTTISGRPSRSTSATTANGPWR